jgi:hypothetical protein
MMRSMVPTVCPKCAHERRPGEDSCARCGLLVARWAGFTPEPTHPLIDELWQTLEARWDDDAAHAGFLEEVQRRGGLDLAAARYSARLRRDNDPRAKAGLARAQVLVEQVHAASSAAPPGSRLLQLLAVGVAGALLVLALYLIALALRR